MKKIALFCSGSASQKFANQLADQQEVMGALAEILAEVLMLESSILRAEKMASSNPLGIKLAKYYARLLVPGGGIGCGKLSWAQWAEGDDLRTQMTILRRLSKHEPVNTVTIGREISAAMVEAGQYSV